MSEEGQPPSRYSGRRLGLFLLLTLALAAASYLLVELTLPHGSGGSGTISLTFLFVVPAALSAFLSYVSDPAADRSLLHYFRLPFFLVLLTLAVGLLFLGEGMICILMLLPIWAAAALVGSIVIFLVRRSRRGGDRLFWSAILLLPIVSAQAEAGSIAETRGEVAASEIVIEAPPERVWPLLLTIPNVTAEEGHWNVTQDLLGVPRPSEAVLTSRDGDFVRLARWGSEIRFEERITEVRPGRLLRWEFAFPDDSIARHTDRHVSPDGAHLKITTGSYDMTPLPGRRTMLRLETHYQVTTPINAYASLWGDWMLGDIQENVLAIVKERAEGLRAAGRSR